jgi:hypothetical protein
VRASQIFSLSLTSGEVLLIIERERIFDLNFLDLRPRRILCFKSGTPTLAAALPAPALRGVVTATGWLMLLGT